jgi:hypothetical protein
MNIDIQIRDNHLHFNGVNYFRGHAEEVLLGDVGEKCTPATQTNYLAVQGGVVRKNLQIHSTSVVTLKGAAIGSADIGIGIDVPGMGKLSAGSVANALVSGELSLLKLSVLPAKLWGLVNDNPTKALQPLKAAGSGGRMVHQVWVLLAAKTAAVVNSATGFEIGTSGSAMTLKTSGGVGGSAGTSLTLSPGSTFAYLLLNPVWDARQQKNWTRVVDAKDDQWSLY